MSDTPEVVRHGRVTARLVRFLADSPDPGQVPDELPLSGTVTLTPQVSVMRWPTTTPPRLAAVERLVCPVIDGDLYPPGTTAEALPAEPGVVLVASCQPDAEPDLVQWSASFQLADESGHSLLTQPPTVRFEVPDGEAVDLATVVPAQPASGTVVVVSSADRAAAEVAAAQAAEHAAAAGTARDATEQTVTAGLTWAGDVDLTAVAAGPVMLHATLTGNATLRLPTPGAGRAFTVTLAVTQDATGGRTVMVPGALAPHGLAPAPSGPGLVDLVHLLWTGAGWVVATGAPALGVPAGWA